MTPEEARVTGANVPVQLGDKTFNLKTLSDRDIAELDEWVRSEYIRTAISGMPSNMPEESRKLYFTVVTKNAVGLTWIGGEGARMIATLPGVARLMWQSIKGNHPEVTYEECRSLVMNANSVHLVNEAFKRANTLPSKSKRQVKKLRKPSSITSSVRRTK